MKRLLVILCSIALAAALCVPVFAADEIDHDAAVEFATDFLSDYLNDCNPRNDYEIDYSKYTSSERLIKYLSAMSQYAKNIQTMGYGDPFVEETELEIVSVRVDDIDGCVQITLHWAQDLRQEDWGWSEFGDMVYILVGDGENGLEIRDYYKKGDFLGTHRGFDYRHQRFFFTETDFWESTEADELLEFQAKEYREALRRWVRPEYLYLFTDPDDEPSPETGKEFPIVTAIFGVIGLGMIKKFTA